MRGRSDSTAPPVPALLSLPRHAIYADYPLIDQLKAAKIRDARSFALQALGEFEAAAIAAVGGANPELVFGFRTIAEVIWHEKRAAFVEAANGEGDVDEQLRQRNGWKAVVDELRALEQDAAPTVNPATDLDDGLTPDDSHAFPTPDGRS